MGLIRFPIRPPASLGAKHSRSICCTSAKSYQHVLYFGNVLGYNSVDRLSKFPRAWLDSVGVSADVDHGLRWTSASGGPGHALFSYTLLEQPVDPSMRRKRMASDELTTTSDVDRGAAEEADEGEILEDESGRKSTSSQPSKVFAVGRNTHAQLGLGFSSQEATRGMVTGQMEGKCGVDKVVAGSGFSFVVTTDSSDAAEEAVSNVYGFGNDTLGQLGSSTSSADVNPSSGDPYDISTRLSGSDAPQLRLLPLPKRLNFNTEHEEENSSGWRVKDLCAGLDHSLALVERSVNGFRIQQVLSSGLNTDGQLGLTPAEKADAVPMLPLLSRTFQSVPGLPIVPTPKTSEAQHEFVGVVCGADTSYALTAAGDLWVWGNSEYGQSFAGIQDRIPHPTLVPNPLLDAYKSNNLGRDLERPPRLKKLVAGGSFAAILDDHGRVWVVGYGPRGSSSSQSDEWEKLSLVQGFPSGSVVEDLFCGLEYLIAITRSKQGVVDVWIWGIPPRSISTLPIHHPTPVPYTMPKTPRQKWLDKNPRLKHEAASAEQADGSGSMVCVQSAACTRDHLLLVLEDGLGSDVWAECVQPPREKGTDVTL